MDAPIETGYYVDPNTNFTFYVKKVGEKLLYPSWIKSKPTEWKKVKKEVSKT